MKGKPIVLWYFCMPLMVALTCLLMACATNPATGGSQIMLISEQQEIAMGREEDQNVVRSMGLYDDPELQAYVSDLGLMLARSSERPDLPWSFKVIDDPVVNAFALPGGYIYVTRGILAHMGSEAQLVSVLGHEIGHVTARHSASQISKAQLAGIGLGLGVALAPELMAVGDLLQAGAGLMFLKFSRDDERQADDLGLRYSYRNGYDLRESPKVHATLRRVGELGTEGRIPGWMSTHPEPENRIGRLNSEIAQMGQTPDNAKVGRNGLLRQLDGLVWGENSREGFFEGSRFYHPEMAFQLDFPTGWEGVNQRASVGAVSSARDAAVVLTLSKHSDPTTAAREFVRETGVSAGRLQQGQFNGLPAAWMGFEGVSGQTSISGRVAFVRHGGRIFELLGYTASSRWDQYRTAIDQSLQSFSRVTDPRILNVKPARIEIVQIPRSMTLREFQQAYPSTIPIEKLAVINEAQPETRFTAGDFVKRVVGGPQAQK